MSSAPHAGSLPLFMMVVQPIRLIGDLLDRAIVGSVDLGKLDARLAEGPDLQRLSGEQDASDGIINWSVWAKPADYYAHFMSSFRVLRRIGDRADVFAKDLAASAARSEDHRLNKRLAAIESRLIFDLKLNCFLVVHEINFLFDDEDDLASYIDGAATGSAPRDFYNELRDLFVVDDAPNGTHADGASVYVRQCNEIVRAETLRTLREDFEIAAKLDDVIVPARSGNISFVVCPRNGGAISAALIERLEKINRQAEVFSKLRRVNVEPDEVCVFGGRFHTIILARRSRIRRYLHVQFHMQFFWAYIHQLLGLLDSVQTELVTRNPPKKVDSIVPKARTLLVKAQLLSDHRAALKAYLESDAESVYDAVQRQWNIDDGMSQIEQSTVFLRDYFDYRESRERNRGADRIGVVLLAISLLQLLGLLSFWRDYLALTEPTFTSKSPVAQIFGHGAALPLANLALPPVLILCGVLGTAILLLRRRRD
jgi:hypothetical protein